MRTASRKTTRPLHVLPWLACLWLAVVQVVGEDVSETGSVGRDQCPSWSWAAQDQIPIFDPLSSPDSEESRQQIRYLDERLRSTVEGELRKRGWTRAPSATCLVSYSLIQELDLDVARYESGGMVPGNVGNAGGGLGAASPDSYLRKRGTFTLDISIGDPPERIWRGTLSDSLGPGRESAKKSVDLAKKVSRVIPKQ